jgi:hypothetical protein
MVEQNMMAHKQLRSNEEESSRVRAKPFAPRFRSAGLAKSKGATRLYYNATPVWVSDRKTVILHLGMGRAFPQARPECRPQNMDS